MATVSEALFSEWFAGVRAEHMALGREQGIEQGVERGVQQERVRWLARLRRHAAIKFGAQAAERLANLLGTEDWLFECDRAEDLLARVSAMRGNGSVGR